MRKFLCCVSLQGSSVNDHIAQLQAQLQIKDEEVKKLKEQKEQTPSVQLSVPSVAAPPVIAAEPIAPPVIEAPAAPALPPAKVEEPPPPTQRAVVPDAPKAVG